MMNRWGRFLLGSFFVESYLAANAETKSRQARVLLS